MLDGTPPRIIGTSEELGGLCPDIIAYDHFQMAKLIRVEKTYALYKPHTPTPAEDDGA